MDISARPQLAYSSTDHSRPAIGILANLVDYSTLAAALAGDARTVMLDKRSAVAAMRDGAVDLLVVAPRHDWWAEIGDIADVEREARRTHTAVLALVPRGDAAALALAFDNGVADCAAYPIEIHEVMVRVRSLLRRKRVADRRRNEASEIRRLALTDPVTGIWNRHHLDTDLAVKVAAASAGARPLSLLMIDIDRFKPINDHHGHASGDKVLRQVATGLCGGIRSSDTLARFGGDELVLVMPDTAIDVAARVAERLRALVEMVTDVPFSVTVSIGVAELGFDETAAMLLAKADNALYAAKLAGRNRVAAAS